MPITILCPRLTCRALLRVPEQARGKRVRCSECGMTLVIPASGTAKPKAPKPQPESAPKE